MSSIPTEPSAVHTGAKQYLRGGGGHTCPQGAQAIYPNLDCGVYLPRLTVPICLSVSGWCSITWRADLRDAVNEVPSRVALWSGYSVNLRDSAGTIKLQFMSAIAGFERQLHSAEAPLRCV